jgi:hypothetical protein
MNLGYTLGLITGATIQEYATIISKNSTQLLQHLNV